jgi:hypothetical protein
MNWGHKIVFAYIGFAGFIGLLAVKAMRQDIDLVSKDYYEQEIQYQDQIGRMKNAGEAESQLIFDYVATEKLAKITFPVKHFTTAKLMFYRPSDAKKDFQMHLKANGKSSSFNIPLSQLSNGLWKAKILWTDGKKEFYKETDFVI